MILYKQSQDGYVLEVEGVKTKEGTLKETATLMYKLGVTFEEIEIGFEELIKNDHTQATYGINKMFVFSKKDE